MTDNFHLDAELLNAFAEGVLPEHERQQCLSHLADCTRCREIVMLAQPASPDPVPVPAPTANWGWRRWFAPATALAACAVIATVAIVSRPLPLPPLPKLQVATAQPAAVPTIPTRSEPLPAPRPATQLTLKRKSLPPTAPQTIAAIPMAPAAAAPPMPSAPPPQSANGALEKSKVKGSVTDETGSSINGASVTVRAASGAVAGFTRTDPSGQFAVDSLTPGKYDVQVERPGFRKDTVQVEVKPQETATLASTLHVGSTSNSVEVEASASAGFITVPSRSRMTLGKHLLSFDSNGTVSLSTNTGKSWKPVKPQWTGKVTGIVVIGQQFQLTTDTGDVRTSKDGAHWKAPKK